MDKLSLYCIERHKLEMKVNRRVRNKRKNLVLLIYAQTPIYGSNEIILQKWECARHAFLFFRSISVCILSSAHDIIRFLTFEHVHSTTRTLNVEDDLMDDPTSLCHRCHRCLKQKKNKYFRKFTYACYDFWCCYNRLDIVVALCWIIFRRVFWTRPVMNEGGSRRSRKEEIRNNFELIKRIEIDATIRQCSDALKFHRINENRFYFHLIAATNLASILLDCWVLSAECRHDRWRNTKRNCRALRYNSQRN